MMGPLPVRVNDVQDPPHEGHALRHHGMGMSTSLQLCSMSM